MARYSKVSHLLISTALMSLAVQGYMILAPLHLQADVSQTTINNNVTNDVTQVTASEFSKYFKLNKDTMLAGESNNGNQLITLTSNQRDQVGNFTLKNKIDMHKSFKLSGQLNLGNKSMDAGGADGVSIVFHPGKIDQIGQGGAATGFGGIPGAFGFKWDTYHNPNDPDEFANNQAYAAFVRNDVQNSPEVDLKTAQKIANPVNNNFIPVEVQYDGNSHVMTIRYGEQTFTKNLTEWIGNNQAMALAMTASTGANFNLQQFKFQSFDYTSVIQKSNLKIEYQDENGHEIRPSTTMIGPVNSPFVIQPLSIYGYQYRTSSNQLHGKFAEADQTIVLTYQQIPTGSMTVHFVDQNGHQLAPDKTVTGLAGDAFNLDIPTVNGYTPNTKNNTITGYLRAGANEQTLTFEPITTHMNIIYQDENGQQLQAPTILTGTYLTPYSIVPSTIANYQYINSNIPLSGSFGITNKTIVLTYTRIPAESIIHFKTANGKMLAPDIVLTGFIGDSYQADMPKITGYTPVLANSVITGLFKLPKEEQTVVYQPITTDININYLDQNGQQLAPKKVISGEFGTTYQLQPIILPGYEYIANSANLTGNFEANTTNISLSYQRLIGHVEVVFLTNHHHPLLPRKVVSGYFGDNYRIEIPNVKGFTSNIKALTGTFDDKTRQIIVTYTPIPIKPVTVNLHIINQQNDQVVRIITLQGKVGERIMFNKAFYMKLLAQYGLKPVDLQTWPKVFVINNDTPAESVLSFMVVPVDKQIPMPTDIINKGQTLADSERSNKAILQKITQIKMLFRLM